MERVWSAGDIRGLTKWSSMFQIIKTTALSTTHRYEPCPGYPEFLTKHTTKTTVTITTFRMSVTVKHPVHVNHAVLLHTKFRLLYDGSDKEEKVDVATWSDSYHHYITTTQTTNIIYFADIVDNPSAIQTVDETKNIDVSITWRVARSSVGGVDMYHVNCRSKNPNQITSLS
jgi:hypothetical protein